MGAADAIRRGLGQADKADFALRHQLRHRPHRILHRHRRIGAVLIIQVDDIDAEPLQAGAAGFDDVLGAPVTPLDCPGR